MRISSVIISFLSIIILLSFSSFVFAQGIITDWKDYSLMSNGNNSYKNVYSIAIVKLSPSNSTLSDNVSSLVKGIYYYFTEELHYPDIPFNYIVGFNGEVFKGTSGGVDVQGYGNQNHGIVSIAYLSDGSGTISSIGKQRILNLVSSLMNNLSIPKNMVSPYNFKIAKNGINYLPIANSKFGAQITSLLQSSNLPQIKIIPSKTRPFLIPHTITITSIGTPPTTSVGNKSLINVSFKNSGTTPLLGSMNIESSNAGFFDIPNVWSSVSIVKTINNLNIQPGSVYNLSFYVLDPKNTGNIKGSFYLVNSGAKITGSTFNVSLDITNTNSQSILSDPQSSSVEIYQSDSLSSKGIENVSNGTTVNILSHTPGWFNVALPNGIKGFVVSAYVVSK